MFFPVPFRTRLKSGCFDTSPTRLLLPCISIYSFCFRALLICYYCSCFRILARGQVEQQKKTLFFLLFRRELKSCLLSSGLLDKLQKEMKILSLQDFFSNLSWATSSSGLRSLCSYQQSRSFASDFLGEDLLKWYDHLFILSVGSFCLLDLYPPE